MEAVPRLPMISFELKVSPENVQFGPQLKQVTVANYSQRHTFYPHTFSISQIFITKIPSPTTLKLVI
jgi:hypothetical protein